MYKFLAVFSLLTQLVFSQEDRAKVLAETINEASLKLHVKNLSSDEMEGRETGTSGQKKAAIYIMQQFSKQEIEPYNGTYFQRFPLLELDPKKTSLSFNGVPLKFMKDYLHYCNFDNTKSTTTTAVFAGYGEEKALNDNRFEFKNNAVFIIGHRKEGDTEQLIDRIHKIYKRGASAVFVIEDYLNTNEKHLSTKQQTLATDTFTYQLPVFYVDKEWTDSVFTTAAGFELKKWIKSKEKKQKNARINLSIKIETNTVSRSLNSENVFAFIPGDSKKDEVIVLMAHYDHLGKKGKEVFNGADDNASGTAALIEIAEAFNLAKEMGGGFRRSILLLLVSGEEKGLLGSAYYCQHPIFSFSQTKAVLNIDMIGRNDTHHSTTPNYLYIIGSDFVSPVLHQINEAQNLKYSQLDLDYRYNTKIDPNRFFYRSDHYNFAKEGIPAIFYFSGIHSDYHTVNDTYDKIDFRKLEKISRHIFYTAWELVTTDSEIK